MQRTEKRVAAAQVAAIERAKLAKNFLQFRQLDVLGIFDIAQADKERTLFCVRHDCCASLNILGQRSTDQRSARAFSGRR